MAKVEPVMIKPSKVIINILLAINLFYQDPGKDSNICYNRPTYFERRNIMIAERSEFKGRPMLVLKRSEDEKFPFSFGLNKAKMILENIEEIKKFVQENDKAA